MDDDGIRLQAFESRIARDEKVDCICTGGKMRTWRAEAATNISGVIILTIMSKAFLL